MDVYENRLPCSPVIHQFIIIPMKQGYGYTWVFFSPPIKKVHTQLSSWLIVFPVIPMKSYHIYIYIHINPQVMGLTANLTIEIRPSGKTLGSSGRSRGRCLATGPESQRAREGLGGPCERI